MSRPQIASLVSIASLLRVLASPGLAAPALHETQTNHWAYQPLNRVVQPAVRNSSWPLTGIDRFILAKLEDHRLPAPAPASPETLCRRLYFDLTGLPPKPEELDEFQKSAISNPQSAISNLVDRLLASPRFGEHFARHWLDVARFGESLSLRGFVLKQAWRYRDYVIDAFNLDEPFDQFVREQLAGDLLPAGDSAARRRQCVAVTFLALGNSNLEEQDKKQLDMDVVDEQLDTLGKAFLAQTIGCARCHDHKFDPIPTRDYYAMAGILRNTRLLKHANVSEWLEFPLPVDAALEEKIAAHEAGIAALEAEIQSAKAAVRALAARSSQPQAGARAAGIPPGILAPRDLPGIVVDNLDARQVGSWTHSTYSGRYIGDGFFHDGNQEKGAKTLTFQPELPRAGRYEVRLAYVPARNRATNIPVTIFHADGETTVPVNEQEPPPIDGRFVSLGTFRFETNGFAHALVANENTRGYVTADAVQFLSEAPLVEPGPPPRKSGARKPKPDPREHHLNPAPTAPDLKALEEKLRKLKAAGPRRPMTMGVKETDHVEDCPIHVRGSVHNLGQMVPRGFLTFGQSSSRQPLPGNESGRRQLADWIASPSNPLTARVYVNRVWLWLLGEGLVRTPDNFGTTGEFPSHPELLDYLAANFTENGWSTKWLVREIVLSRAYQLSGMPMTAGEKAGKWESGSLPPAHSPTFPLSTSFTSSDREYRRFAYSQRRRLTAEQLRDAILSISGQLKFPPGGPTFPATQTADFGFKFDEPVRSVYIPVFRNALPEWFDAFDFPSPSVVTGKRNTSTVSTQALFLMNHPWVRDQARAAARRALDRFLRDDAGLLEWAYRATLGRAPEEGERRIALNHLKVTSKTARLEAWTELFHALFSSADFRYLD